MPPSVGAPHHHARFQGCRFQLLNTGAEDSPLPRQAAEVARSYFTDAPNVKVVEVPIEDGWTRDWGPSVLH